jgi:hypothetical protein
LAPPARHHFQRLAGACSPITHPAQRSTENCRHKLVRDGAKTPSGELADTENRAPELKHTTKSFVTFVSLVCKCFVDALPTNRKEKTLQKETKSTKFKILSLVFHFIP